MIRAVIATTAMATALLAGAGPAEAKAKTELTLSYVAEAGFAAAVILTCNPAGGGHPKPIRACYTLRTVNGQPAKLKPARKMCMMIYSPITAKIAGTWNGKPVNWTRRYANSCQMNRANGILFQF